MYGMYSNHHDWGKRKAGKRGEELGESSPPPQSWTEFGDSLFLPLVIMSTMSPGTRNEYYNARAHTHTHTQAEAVLSVVRTGFTTTPSLSLSPQCASIHSEKEGSRGEGSPPLLPPFSLPALWLCRGRRREERREPLGVEEERVGGDMTSRLMGFVWALAAKWVGGKRRRSELPPPPPSTPPHFFLLPRHKEEVGSFPRDGRCFI